MHSIIRQHFKLWTACGKRSWGATNPVRHNLLHKSRICSVPMSKPIDSPVLLCFAFMNNIARYSCRTSGLHDRNRISLLWVWPTDQSAVGSTIDTPSCHQLRLGLHQCVQSALDLLQNSFPASSIRFITLFSGSRRPVLRISSTCAIGPIICRMKSEQRL